MPRPSIPAVIAAARLDARFRRPQQSGVPLHLPPHGESGQRDTQSAECWRAASMIEAGGITVGDEDEPE